MPSIFVTGAGKGIGRAIVERFAAAEWRVSGVTRAPEDVDSLNRECLGAGGRFFAADATDAGRIGEIAGGIPGGLDLLVNNAGGFRYGGFRDIAPEDLEALWQGNVVSAFTVTRAFLPALLLARGRIANIVSVAALKPLPGKAAYSATKAAQAALFRCLRDEIAEEGVTVTNIYPGVTFTNSFAGEDIDPGILMAPEDVAEAVFRTCTAPGNLVAEELVLQPAQGIRL
ncbi:MAG TPA: SDR family oxidoreductase [Thermohalobaculum sp.]|nr:SDR family oxidoreductase [Thermohalobaculum sp.]